MGILFITADELGSWTGGSAVASQELLALREFADQATRQRRDPSLSSVDVFHRGNLGSDGPEPWKWDQKAVYNLKAMAPYQSHYKLCHIYSGTWPETVKYLKDNGCKVCVTVAAHDRIISRKEHEKLGWPFNLPHLVEHDQWQRYIEGYRLADVIVCPGSVPAQIVRNYGPEFLHKDIRVVPHGCHLPKEIKPLPKSFCVGYGGSFGCDKGIRYLLEAWKKLNYTDGSMLILAGRDSTTPLARHLINQYGGGSIHLAGWQKEMSDFYNSISLYVQPSATEGFACEIPEAMAHGRPVICSDGAGACDLLGDRRAGIVVFNRCVDSLVGAINEAKTKWNLEEKGIEGRQIAENYSWEKVRGMYKKLWTEVLNS